MNFATSSPNPDSISHYVIDRRLSTVLSSYDLNLEHAELIQSDEKNDESKTPRLFMFGVIFCILGISGLFVALYFGMGFHQTPVPTTTSIVFRTTLPISSQIQIGHSCSLSIQCITSAYCDSDTKLCSCSPGLYFDSTVGSCLALKNYNETCSSSTQCNFNQLLLCYNSKCICDSMLFWNPYALLCEDRRGLGETCIGVANECYSQGMICTTVNGSLYTRCVCDLSSMYFSFNTGDCAQRLIPGSLCYNSAHFSCVDYAWCTTWPSDTSLRCTCIPNYYWNSTNCVPKKGYKSACSSSIECMDNTLSLSCINNLCQCSGTANWNGTTCNYLKPYGGGPCNSNSDCLNSNTICQWVPIQSTYLCICPAGTYFSLLSDSCVSYVELGQLCTDSSQCIVNSSCVLQTSTSDYRCQCQTSAYYQSSTTSCQFLNSYLSYCTSSSSCQASPGLVCINSTCTCSSNYFWNGLTCQTQLGYNSNIYNQTCQTSSWCKNALGLNNCVIGKCNCDYSKVWNGTICV